jgi:hypothetical protein
MRRLSIGGETYLWRVLHRHVPDPAATEGRRCEEVLTVYRDGFKKAPLRIVFGAGEGRDAGYPEAGVVTIYGPPPESFNLNQPGIVSAVIDRAIELGWSPEREYRPHIVEDGFDLVRSACTRDRD